jgi:uncharacterized protein (TIGR00369 family)
MEEMDRERIELPKLKGHYCFACGTANPIGLDLHFYLVNDSVCADITLGKYHEGWQNMAHGGIITTLLDEVMSWAVIYFRRSFFVTRKIDVKFVKPVRTGVSLTAKGRLAKEKEGRYLEAVGELVDANGKILARSIGQFVILSKERLSLVSEDLKNEMLSLMKRLPEP